MGGVLKIWAIPPKDIAITGTGVSFSTQANIINILVKEDSCSFDEDLATSFAGSAYKVEIKATVSCDTNPTLAIISELERAQKYLVIYLDGNGLYKLSGTKEVPLRFMAKATTGNASSALNKYDITFSGLQTRRAIHITNPFE